MRYTGNIYAKLLLKLKGFLFSILGWIRRSSNRRSGATSSATERQFSGWLSANRRGRP